MRHQLPTNFFSRQELQQLVDRAIGLVPSLPRGLAAAVGEVARWAAAIDYHLAKWPAEERGEVRYTRIFQNAEPWHYDWTEQRHVLHTDRGLFFIALGQKVMIRPGKGGGCLPIPWYRLVLGDPEAEPLYSDRLEDLKAPVLAYLARFRSACPQQSGNLDRVVGALFGEEGSTTRTTSMEAV